MAGTWSGPAITASGLAMSSEEAVTLALEESRTLSVVEAYVAAENPGWAKLGVRPGLCLGCRFAKISETRRGTAYLRCLRSAWDVRLVRYPRLPVTDCVGFEAPK